MKAADRSIAPLRATKQGLCAPEVSSGPPPIRAFDWSDAVKAELAHRYQLGEQIGQGGMSRVFAAHDRLTRQRIAIKVISLGRDAERPIFVGRFRREVEVAQQLKGPAFARIYDHAVREHCAYLTMDLLEGENLQSYLSREGRLDRYRTLNLMRGLARGLEAAHDLCIVHRDLKPSNVFISRTGGVEVVRLLDFGIAKDLWTSASLTMAGALVGSPHYVSPEQARCDDLDHRSDLWSLGVILYRCLTGFRPFEGAPSKLILSIVTDRHTAPCKLVPSMPSAVDAFFERALAKDPEARFQDIGAMSSALGAALFRRRDVLEYRSLDAAEPRFARRQRVRDGCGGVAG